MSPLSERKTICWFSCIPCHFSNSHRRRRGFYRKSEKAEAFGRGRIRRFPRGKTPRHSCRPITSNHPSLWAARTKPPSIPTVIAHWATAALPNPYPSPRTDELVLPPVPAHFDSQRRGEVTAHGFLIQGVGDGQHVLQELGDVGVGNQRGPLRPQLQQLLTGLSGEPTCYGPKRAWAGRLTQTSTPAWIRHLASGETLSSASYFLELCSRAARRNEDTCAASVDLTIFERFYLPVYNERS